MNSAAVDLVALIVTAGGRVSTGPRAVYNLNIAVAGDTAIVECVVGDAITPERDASPTGAICRQMSGNDAIIEGVVMDVKFRRKAVKSSSAILGCEATAITAAKPIRARAPAR
jgi:hypothetical protein